MPKKQKPEIIALKYLWWGVSIGGTHYTGEICVEGREKIELERKLSLKEAKELAEKDGRMYFSRLDRVTNRFDSFEQLAGTAKKWAEKNLGEHWLIMEHDIDNPWRPVAAKGRYESHFKALMELAIAWDKVPDSKREGQLWDDVYDVFYRLTFRRK